MKFEDKYDSNITIASLNNAMAEAGASNGFIVANKMELLQNHVNG